MEIPLVLYMLRILMIGGAIISIGMLAYFMFDTKTWRTDPEDSDEDRKARVQNRGTIVSIFSSIILGTISVWLTNSCAPSSNIEVLNGFLFGPIVGYMLDIGLGTDVGFGYFKQGDLWNGFSLMFSSLISYAFLRFIITFVLDMFISKPITGIFKGYTTFKLQNLKLEGYPMSSLDRLIKTYLVTIVQIVVGLITFQAYTNQTRFLWAYPDKTLPLEQRVSSIAIMLATAVSGAFFLYAYRTDAKELTLNLTIVIGALLIITILSMTEQLDAPVEEKEEGEEGEGEEPPTLSQTAIGVAVFVLFVIVGVLTPFWNGLNNREENGKCKASAVEGPLSDPVAKSTHNALSKDK